MFRRKYPLKCAKMNRQARQRPVNLTGR
uniref:Uncharacterized protein n=1 Tax=Anguilla anguilla TaxID=7936 RepID=A0A0E9XA69_ANGAN